MNSLKCRLSQAGSAKYLYCRRATTTFLGRKWGSIRPLDREVGKVRGQGCKYVCSKVLHYRSKVFNPIRDWGHVIT